MDKRRLTISLERRDYDDLLAVSQQEERSLSWLIGRALKLYLQEHRVGQQLTIPEGLSADQSRRIPDG